ncbi:hypothetical protein CF326_g8943 [Tilletia indica]|nr:hypothetical protein CF326_g8943 [Tilletia indica]
MDNSNSITNALALGRTLWESLPGPFRTGIVSAALQRAGWREEGEAGEGRERFDAIEGEVQALWAAQAAQEKRFDRVEDGVGEILSLLRKRGREKEDGEEKAEKAGKKVKKGGEVGKGKKEGEDEEDLFLKLVADTLKTLTQQSGASHVERSDIEAALERRIGHPVALKNVLHRHPEVFVFVYGRPGGWSVR